MKISPNVLAIILATVFVAAPAASVTPANARDWLAPLQDLADQLTAPAKRPATNGPSAPIAPSVPVVERPSVAPVAPPIPQPRPDFLGETAPEAAPTATPAAAAPMDMPTTPVARPEPAPESASGDDGTADSSTSERIYQSACPAVLQGLVQARTLPPIAEGVCGSQSPLEVSAVLVRGRMVKFSTPVTTDCAMASALPGWLETVDGYASTVLKSPVAQINTGPGYVCRLRNNRPTGLVSEHGMANALDISGFTLADGRAIAVKTDWLPGNLAAGRLLRLAHDAACGRFTTVLGPEANADHDDHIHLDLGCHGQSCTAQICE
ncbi:MAG: extensin family protein [Devosia sp.]